MDDNKKLLSFTEISEELDRARYHFKESHRHALQGMSSLLKILTIILEQNAEIPGARAINTVVMLIKASIDIWASKVAPDGEPEILTAKLEAYDTILEVLKAEIDILKDRGLIEEKKDYIEALTAVVNYIEKEKQKIGGDEKKTSVVEVPIE